jgi:hypothetical protein
MAQTRAYTLAHYAGTKIHSGFTWRRLQLGYTYLTLGNITGIRPNRIVKLAGLNARAQPEEVTALAKALVVSRNHIEEWLICILAPR